MKLDRVGEPTVLSAESAIFTKARHELRKRWLSERGYISGGQEDLESLSKVLRWNENIYVSRNAVSGVAVKGFCQRDPLERHRGHLGSTQERQYARQLRGEKGVPKCVAPKIIRELRLDRLGHTWKAQALEIRANQRQYFVGSEALQYAVPGECPSEQLLCSLVGPRREAPPSQQKAQLIFWRHIQQAGVRSWCAVPLNHLP